MNALEYPSAPSPEHLAQLTAARAASKKIRRAVSVASFDGWSVALFAAISLLASFGNWSGISLGVAMGVVAWRELTSGAALKRLHVDSLRVLAINQLVLCGILILYFAWSLFDSLHGSSNYAEILGSDSSAGTLGNVDQLSRQISVIVYVALMLGSVLFQGGTARYYFSRTKILQDYIATTPKWIIDYQRGGGTL